MSVEYIECLDRSSWLLILLTPTMPCIKSPPEKKKDYATSTAFNVKHLCRKDCPPVNLSMYPLTVYHQMDAVIMKF